MTNKKQEMDVYEYLDEKIEELMKKKEEHLKNSDIERANYLENRIIELINKRIKLIETKEKFELLRPKTEEEKKEIENAEKERQEIKMKKSFISLCYGCLAKSSDIFRLYHSATDEGLCGRFEPNHTRRQDSGYYFRPGPRYENEQLIFELIHEYMGHDVVITLVENGDVYISVENYVKRSGCDYNISYGVEKKFIGNANNRSFQLEDGLKALDSITSFFSDYYYHNSKKFTDELIEPLGWQIVDLVSYCSKKSEEAYRNMCKIRNERNQSEIIRKLVPEKKEPGTYEKWDLFKRIQNRHSDGYYYLTEVFAEFDDWMSRSNLYASYNKKLIKK